MVAGAILNREFLTDGRPFRLDWLREANLVMWVTGCLDMYGPLLDDDRVGAP